MRATILIAGLLPYAYFGLKDNLYHFKHRNIGLLEKLVHAAIVISVCTIVSNAFIRNFNIVVAALLIFAAARTLDEFVFHRDVGAEADVHAKTHLAFLIFVIAVMAVEWLDRHDWRFVLGIREI